MIDGIVEWLPSILQFAGGVVVGAFIAGRYFGHYTQDMEAIKRSLASHLDGHEALCDRQKELIIASLRREVNEAVRDAVKDLTIDHNRQLAAMDKSIALQAQCMQAMKRSLDALSERFDRRSNDESQARMSGYDYGKRRNDGDL